MKPKGTNGLVQRNACVCERERGFNGRDRDRDREGPVETELLHGPKGKHDTRDNENESGRDDMQRA